MGVKGFKPTVKWASGYCVLAVYVVFERLRIMFVKLDCQCNLNMRKISCH